jgi:hypothetical protein
MKGYKSNKLFIIWALSQVILLAICSAYVASCYIHGSEPRLENSIYSMLIILSVVLYSLPMLFTTLCLAKKEQNKGILVATRVLIAFFCCWLLLYMLPRM